MDDRQIGRLFTAASLGRISRHQLLETGLRLGIGTPMLTALYAAVPAAATATVASTPARLPTRQANNSGTLTMLISVGTEDIDPHYSYTTLSRRSIPTRPNF